MMLKKRINLNYKEDLYFAYRYDACICDIEPDESLSEYDKSILINKLFEVELVSEENGYYYLLKDYYGNKINAFSLGNSTATLSIDFWTEEQFEDFCEDTAYELPILSREYNEAETAEEKLAIYAKIAERMKILNKYTSEFTQFMHL